jgi:hypothetical protein
MPLWLWKALPASSAFAFGLPPRLQETNAHRSYELHTDEGLLYTAAGKEFAAHETAEHGWNQRGYYVGSEGQTTNNVKYFFGIFKRSMKGVYHFRGEQHLQRYLDEFSFRYSTRVGLEYFLKLPGPRA